MSIDKAFGSSSANPENVLANSLANNHAYSSLGPKGEPAGFVRQEFQIPGYDRRVVVIVGSGASQDANLPGTEKFMSQLRTPEFPLPEIVIEKELDRLESVHKLNRKQFETCLLAMSATEHSGKVVRDKIVEVYDRRFLTTLPYELLAHLLKHRFVDAIISFNFDELLDQAIKDELNTEEYFFILSDGDCPKTPLAEAGNVLEKPFFIKPHGTVTHSSTLRFTRDDYYRLPLGIQRVIENLLSDRPIDLISIGFDMKSFEFNHLLRKAKPDSRIFYINLYKPKPDPKLPHITPYLIKVEKKEGALGNTLGRILDKTYECFLPSFTPRAINRHRFLAGLFESERQQREDNVEYLWDRTVIELALAIAKAKGFVTMSVLSAGRVGMYFTHYRERERKEKKTLKQLCEAIGLNDVAYGFDALRLSTTELEPKILSRDEFDFTMDSFLTKVEKQLTSARRGIFDELRDQFKKTLEMHYAGAEVEIRAKPQILHDGLFQTAEVIRTKTALDCHTLKLLENDKWESLLLVSETGEWLTQPTVKDAIKIERHPKRRIYLIVADDSHLKDVLGAYTNQVAFLSMPWWDHNKHLTLFLDSSDKVMCSIYFTRQRRATDIVPLYLGESDSEIVFEFWKAYWTRARDSSAWVNRETIKNFELPPKGGFYDLESLRKSRLIAQRSHTAP